MIIRIKYLIALCAAASFMLASCVQDPWRENPVPGADGIAFNLSTSYDNGEAEDFSPTRTSYSGDRVGITYLGSMHRYERIDWLAGDRIRIHCDQALSIRGNEIIYEAETSGDDSGKNSMAPAIPVPDAGGKKDGFSWAGPDVLHHFFAVYPDQYPAVPAGSFGGTTPPSSPVLSIGEGISGDTGDDIATVSGFVPQKQTATRNDKGHVLEYEPDMRLVAMASYCQRYGAAPGVPLYFKPLVTTVRFSLLGHEDDRVTAEGTGYKLTNLKLYSSMTDSPGLPAPRMWGEYKVAFGQYAPHAGIPPTYADPSDPSTMTDPGLVQTFSSGRGINGGLHDIDGEDNAIVLLSSGFPSGLSYSDVRDQNYVEITVPDNGVELSESKPTAFTFICLPETQTHLSLELTFVNPSTSEVATRTFKLQHQTSWISLRGHFKTYFDNLPVRRPEYILRVTPKNQDFPVADPVNPNLTYVDLTEYFTIVSYRDKSTAEPVKWTATFSDRGDLPQNYSSTPPSWLESFFDQSGLKHPVASSDYTTVEGSLEGDERVFTVGVSRNASVTWSVKASSPSPGPGEGYDLSVPFGDAVKINAPDLSFRDVYGEDLVTRETANCYVVSGQGWYKFPAVYGNAIMNGVTNRSSFTGKPSTNANYADNILQAFVRHDGNPIAAPWIRDNGITIKSAKLLWQDSPNLVSNVTFSDDYLYFQWTGTVEGNAVVAAYDGPDGTGDIVWSWHIWGKHDPDNDLATICLETAPDFYSDVEHNHIMRSNLGFSSNSASSTTPRVCHVKFRQVDDAGNIIPEGGQATIIISQTGTEAGTNVPFYQWGRKDPMFPGRLARDSDGFFRNSRIYKEGSEYLYASGESDTRANKMPNPPTATNNGGSGYSNGVAFAIRNPISFIPADNGTDKAGPLKTWSGTNVYLNLWNTNVTDPVIRSNGPTTPSISYPRDDDRDFLRKDVVVRKTVYDPCPPGFCVPNEYAFSIFSKAIGSTGGHYSGNASNINAALLPGKTISQSFDQEYGYTFYTTSDGEIHTQGRVFMRAVGRRSGNGTSNNKGELTSVPQSTGSGNAYGYYWTAAPYIFEGGSKRWAYARTFQFGRTMIIAAYGTGGRGSSGYLMAHAHPVRPIWDKDSDRNDTNHGHI